MLKNRTPLEDSDQIKLSTWLTKKGIRHTASANGAKRTITAAMKLKAMGMSAGFPDLFIPIPSGVYHGLMIELKRLKGGKVSENQQHWLQFLTEKGYYAVVCHGLEEAKEVVLHYFSFTPKAA